MTTIASTVQPFAATPTKPTSSRGGGKGGSSGSSKARRSPNTSMSSVNTEVHNASVDSAYVALVEPSSRRRVSATTVGEAILSPTLSAVLVQSPSVAVGVRRHNPYLYNVLGENATPDFAARTSPLPGSPTVVSGMGYLVNAYASAFPPTLPPPLSLTAHPMTSVVVGDRPVFSPAAMSRERSPSPIDCEDPMTPNTCLARSYRNGRPVAIPKRVTSPTY